MVARGAGSCAAGPWTSCRWPWVLRVRGHDVPGARGHARRRGGCPRGRERVSRAVRGPVSLCERPARQPLHGYLAQPAVTPLPAATESRRATTRWGSSPRRGRCTSTGEVRSSRTSTGSTRSVQPYLTSSSTASCWTWSCSGAASWSLIPERAAGSQPQVPLPRTW
ncbi:hypothetical protein QJS66_07010 [Kocuria rhizophila]|nr:hypothetical protein QJS66_07010 [Kocuria rhizophila]